MTKFQLTNLSNLCFALGFVSIGLSIVVWFYMGAGSYGVGAPNEFNAILESQRAYGERLGIFVGLWAPTFFILSNRLLNQANSKKE